MKHAETTKQWCVVTAVAVAMGVSGMPALAQTPPGARIYQPTPTPTPSPSSDCYIRDRQNRCVDATQPRDDPPPRRDDDRNGGIDPVVAVAGAAVVGALLATWFSSGKKSPRGDEPPDKDWLEKNGPQLPTVYPIGSLSVRGFSKNGWPVVLDFKPEPRTWTTLDIYYSKNRTVSLTVDTNGLEGRHLVKLETPKEGPAKKAKAATYVVRSVYLDTRQPAPIEVYGIGGGPRAVGSVAIENVTFTPGVVRPGAQARFDYFAKSAFNHTRAEVLKFVEKGNQIQLEQVMAANVDDPRVGPHNGFWNGLDPQRMTSLGQHRLQVRAWFTSDDKSWVGAISPNLVTVRQ